MTAGDDAVAPRASVAPPATVDVPAGDPARARRQRKLWGRAFLILAIPFGILFVAITPLVYAPDEAGHIARVARMVDGWFIPSTATVKPDSYRLEDCIHTYLRHVRLGKYSERSTRWADQLDNGECRPNTDPESMAANNTAVNPPVPYLPATAGYAIGRAVHGPSGAILGARLAQLAAYIALMWAAITRIPWGAPLLFTIGLLPSALQIAAGVSADPITLGLACLLIASILDLTVRSREGPVDTRSLVLLGVTAMALVLSKPAYVTFIALVVTVPTAAYGSLRRRVAATAAITLPAIIAGATWVFAIVNKIPLIGLHHANSPVAAEWIRNNPRGFLGAIRRGWAGSSERWNVLAGLFAPVERFGTRVPFPLTLGAIWLVWARLIDPIPTRLRAIRHRRTTDPTHGGETSSEAHTSAPGVAGPAGPTVTQCRWTWERIFTITVVAGVAVMTFLLIEYGVALSANPPAPRHIVWVQGRYFLPLLPLTLFGVCARRSDPPRPRTLYAVSAASAIALAGWAWWSFKYVHHWV